MAHKLNAEDLAERKAVREEQKASRGNVNSVAALRKRVYWLERMAGIPLEEG